MLFPLAGDRKFSKLNPSWKTWQEMEVFVAALKPFSCLTDILSADKTVSSCNVFPLIANVKSFVTQELAVSEGDDFFPSDEQKKKIEDIRQKIWKYMDDRYNIYLTLSYKLV